MRNLNISKVRLLSLTIDELTRLESDELEAILTDISRTVKDGQAVARLGTKEEAIKKLTHYMNFFNLIAEGELDETSAGKLKQISKAIDSILSNLKAINIKNNEKLPASTQADANNPARYLYTQLHNEENKIIDRKVLTIESESSFKFTNKLLYNKYASLEQIFFVNSIDDKKIKTAFEEIIKSKHSESEFLCAFLIELKKYENSLNEQNSDSLKQDDSSIDESSSKINLKLIKIQSIQKRAEDKLLTVLMGDEFISTKSSDQKAIHAGIYYDDSVSLSAKIIQDLYVGLDQKPSDKITPVLKDFIEKVETRLKNLLNANIQENQEKLLTGELKEEESNLVRRAINNLKATPLVETTPEAISEEINENNIQEKEEPILTEPEKAPAHTALKRILEEISEKINTISGEITTISGEIREKGEECPLANDTVRSCQKELDVIRQKKLELIKSKENYTKVYCFLTLLNEEYKKENNLNKKEQLEETVKRTTELWKAPNDQTKKTALKKDLYAKYNTPAYKKIMKYGLAALAAISLIACIIQPGLAILAIGGGVAAASGLLLRVGGFFSHNNLAENGKLAFRELPGISSKNIKS